MSQALNNKKANALGPGGLGTRWAEVGGQSVPSPPRRPATEGVRFGVPPETKRPGWQLPRRIPPGPSLPSADPRLSRPPAQEASGPWRGWPLSGVGRGGMGAPAPPRGRASPLVTQEAARVTPFSAPGGLLRGPRSFSSRPAAGVGAAGSSSRGQNTAAPRARGRSQRRAFSLSVKWLVGP